MTWEQADSSMTLTISPQGNISIYEAKFYTTGIREITEAYENRNKEAKPILTRLTKIQKTEKTYFSKTKLQKK